MRPPQPSRRPGGALAEERLAVAGEGYRLRP